RAGYDALDADQQALVGDISRLTDAEAAVAGLEAEAQAAADEIALLPIAANVKLTHKTAVETARATYDSLDADQQALVTNYSRLTDAEAAIAALEAAAQDVKNAIAALPNEADVKLPDKPAVEAARADYDSLDADQQALVTNYSRLTDAEAAIAAQEAA